MKGTSALSTAALGGRSSRETSVRLVDDVKGIGKAGDTVTFSLHPSDVTVNEEMDTFMVGYRAPGFRADDACPIQLVGKDQGIFRVFGVNNAFRPVNVLSSIQADIPEVDADTSTDTYMVQERALGGFIPTVTQLNYDEGNQGFDPKVAIGRRIAWALALDRELRVFGTGGLLTTSGNWNANNRVTLGAGAEWNDIAGGNPIQDLFDRISASAQIVTDIWMNPAVAQAMMLSQAVKEHIRWIIGDSQVSQQIAQATATQQNMDFQIPGLPPIHVVGSKVLDEATGQLVHILGDTVILTSSPPGAANTGEDIMTCKTFRRKGPSGNGFTTREFPLERRGLHGGVFMASGHAEQVKMVANNVGGAIFDVIQ